MDENIKIIPVGHAENLINQKFNYLTVIGRAESPSTTNRAAYWWCKCDCGNYIKVKTSDLKSNHTKSCGCYNNKIRQINGQNNKINLTGQKFGHLTVIKDSGKRYKTYSGTRVVWLCLCDCGKYTEVNADNLKSGNTQSCGKCLNLSHGEEKIIHILQENNIQFEQQKTFNTCYFPSTNRLAKFDFYLSDCNLLIEYDGIQHFIQGTGQFDNQEKFIKTQENDKFKNQWCKENNIPLIRIPYWHYKDLCIEDLKLETSQFIYKGENNAE